jgi:hypothetical protein
MAVTAEQVIDYKGQGQLWAFPVANTATIYGGTLAAVDNNGYLQNMSSTYAKDGRVIVIVADQSGATNGTPAATTAAGSISGSLEVKSNVSGDKTVRNCYMDGYVKLTFTSIAQDDVGKTVYATDNYVVDEAQNSGVKIGTLVTYLSSTSGWVRLNWYPQHDGTVFWKQALSATSGGGGLFNILNPAGETIVIERCALDITTASSTVSTIDVGVAATGTSNDALIDGITGSVTGIFDNITDAGTSGGATVKCTAGQYITGTFSSAASAKSIAGSVGIWYRYWE